MILTNSLSKINGKASFTLNNKEDYLKLVEILGEVGKEVNEEYVTSLCDITIVGIDGGVDKELLEYLFSIDYDNAVKLQATEDFKSKLVKAQQDLPKKECISVYNIYMQIQELVYNIDHNLVFLNEETKCLESTQEVKKYINQFDIEHKDGKTRFNKLLKGISK